MKMNLPRNMSASVRDRLLALAKQQNEEFQNVLTRYANERLLYRLSQSSYCDTFTLKGATLFACWTGDMHRPTRDLDLLGHGATDINQVVNAFVTICSQNVEEDGLVFMPDTVKGTTIKEGEEYEGVRISLRAMLGKASIPVQVDVGYGDAVTPLAQKTVLPTLLKMPSAELFIYPRETVVAEKCQAIVKLGLANSRVKDFYDLWYLAAHFDFDGLLLAQAVKATFRRRKTPVPAQTPTGLTSAYYDDPSHQAQWRAFAGRSSLSGAIVLDFESVIAVLVSFLMPLLIAVQAETAFNQSWNCGVVLWQMTEHTGETAEEISPCDGE